MESTDAAENGWFLNVRVRQIENQSYEKRLYGITIR